MLFRWINRSIFLKFNNMSLTSLKMNNWFPCRLTYRKTFPLYKIVNTSSNHPFIYYSTNFILIFIVLDYLWFLQFSHSIKSISIKSSQEKSLYKSTQKYQFLLVCHFKSRLFFSTLQTHYFISQLMYNPQMKIDTRRPQDKQEPSRVLLVCIYDTIAFEVNNQLVYQRFSKFGPIIKVLIFQKGQVTKLFIQYCEQNHAIQAKNALDGTKLLGAICKMNIYFSNFANVDLKNQTSQGADFTVVQEMKNEYVKKFDQMSRSYQSEQNQLFKEDFIMDAAFTQFAPRSKTDNPRRLNQQIQKVNMMPTMNQHHMINQEQEFQHLINNGINNILETHSSNDRQKPTFSTHHSSIASNQRINPNLRMKETQPINGCILRFEVKRDIKIRYIYNLFSNFGNLSFISKKSSRVYIKFRTLEFAAIARTYLHQRFLMGNLLLLQYPETLEQGLPTEGEFCECIFYDQSFDRFTPHRSLTVNSPSQTLHVSSLKKDICKQHVLYKIFSDFGKVQAVKILCYSNEKNMALVKFYSIEDSFEAISNLHNQVFSGRKMQISFTKSRV